jgi:hypothetical protein
VVLTTSQAPEDIERSFYLHTNAYVTKPAGFDQFISAIGKIDQVFLGLIARPALFAYGTGPQPGWLSSWSCGPSNAL